MEAFFSIPIWVWVGIAVFSLPFRWIARTIYCGESVPTKLEALYWGAKFVVMTGVATMCIAFGESPARLGMSMAATGTSFLFIDIVTGAPFIREFAKCTARQKIFGPLAVAGWMFIGLGAPVWGGHEALSARLSEIVAMRESSTGVLATRVLINPIFMPVIDNDRVIAWRLRDDAAREQWFTLHSALEGYHLRDRLLATGPGNRMVLLEVSYDPREPGEPAVLSTSLEPISWWSSKV